MLGATRSLLHYSGIIFNTSHDLLIPCTLGFYLVLSRFGGFFCILLLVVVVWFFCCLCCKGIKPFFCFGCAGSQPHSVNAAGAAAFVFTVLSSPFDQARSHLLCLAGLGFCHSQSRALP